MRLHQGVGLALLLSFVWHNVVKRSCPQCGLHKKMMDGHKRLFGRIIQHYHQLHWQYQNDVKWQDPDRKSLSIFVLLDILSNPSQMLRIDISTLWFPLCIKSQSFRIYDNGIKYGDNEWLAIFLRRFWSVPSNVSIKMLYNDLFKYNYISFIIYHTSGYYDENNLSLIPSCPCAFFV